MPAERVELHAVPGQLDGHERQGLGVDLLPGGGGQRGGDAGVVEGRLAGARRRVDQHEPPAGAIAHRVPETAASVDPPRPDLVADDELARAGGSAEELLCGLVVLRGGHSFMLAAPAVNPVVLVATAVAFPGQPQMVLGRFLGSLLTSMVVGLVWSRVGDRQGIDRMTMRHR
jgi:hypothetical protein